MSDTKKILETERVSPRYLDIDAWPTRDALDAILEAQMAAVSAVRPALVAIGNAVDDAAAHIGDRGRLVYVGAGTSGRVAVQDGAELPPTFNWPRERLVFAVAGGMEALVRSIEGAEDDSADAIKQMDNAGIGSGDVVLGLAASGTTPFTVSAIARARELGAITVGIASNGGAPLLDAAKHAILIATGAEVIAGSTRMKAGTAQKIVLNLISTGLMLKLGRVYRGRMVDLAARNAKLDRRARLMVADLAGCGEERAGEALQESGGDVKLAVLVAGGVKVTDARSLLDGHDRNLRSALEAAAVGQREPD